jgi:hypothetical protein
MVERLLDRIGSDHRIKFDYLSTDRVVKLEYRSGEWTYVVDNGHVITLCRWFDSQPSRCEEITGFVPIMSTEDEGKLETELRKAVTTLLGD